jgi:diguanylate cyclase (GGDEF)-like protein
VSQSALKLGRRSHNLPSEPLVAQNQSPGESKGGVRSQPAAVERQLLEALARNQQLEQLNACFEAALDHMGRGLSMFDQNQCLLVCNKTYATIYGLPDELTQAGTSISDILSFHMRRTTGAPASPIAISDWIKDHIARLAQHGACEEIQSLSDGRVIRVTYQPLGNGGWVDMQEDITAQRRSDEKIEWLARHDTLTEVANRFHFREYLEREFECYDPRQGFALHWIDLDYFKQINDKHGHLVGDNLLKAVADRLKRCLKAGDVVGRLGGDEFAVLQAGVDREDLASQLSSRMLRELRQPYDILGHRLHADASIGVALAPLHGENPELLFASADAALYRAKSKGRGSYSLYTPADIEQQAATNPLRRELQLALERNELVLHYHPIVDLHEGRVSSFEALMRWKHPSRGMLPPSEFIPIAEETGQIVDMGNWALQRACNDAKSWPDSIMVSVNLSAKQLEHCDVFSSVTDALEATGFDPHRLQLEITETVLMRDQARIQKVLRDLHALGVMITLDDFGTCFATLNYLRSFPFKKIKLDRSFVRDIPEHHDCVAIVKSVGDLARELNMRSVAEGVETAASLAAVCAAGYDEAQGFYFSPPVPARGIKKALTQCSARMAAIKPTVDRNSGKDD